jgi:hypothetical protein
MCQPGRPPQHEVQGVALVGILDVAAALGRQAQHLVPVEVADLPEALEARDVEVDTAAGLVGVAAVEHHADEAADVGDGGGGAGLAPARQQVERPHVVVEAGGLGRGEVQVVDAQLPRLAQQVVVDVGDVADRLGVVPAVPQPALQHVVGEVQRGVADVGGVVRRDAAHVDGDHLPRREGDHLPSGGVVEPQLSPSGARRPGARGWPRGYR